MNKFLRHFLTSCACATLVASCASGSKDGADSNQANDASVDSTACVMTTDEPIIMAYPDTMLSSVKQVDFRVDTFMNDISGSLLQLTNCYEKAPGILTFRGVPTRNMPFSGRVKGTPSKVSVEWVFKTDVDTTRTDYGVWGGGTGWTGQPLLAEWDNEQLNLIRTSASKYVTDHLSNREIIVGSLCGKVYFIDYLTGKASRKSYNVGNPIKGTMSLDPTYCGNLYIGHGVPARQPFGALIINLFDHRRVDTFGRDSKAWRGWGAYDSSPVRVGQFMFRPGENGTLYKLWTDGDTVRLHSTLRYRINGAAPGFESSMAVSRNYGYLSDNHGNIVAVNLETMRPVWHYRNHDDTDATIVVEEENGTPFIYTGCEIDKQGDNGFCYFVKLNGLTGEVVWEQKIEGRKAELGKTTEGGMFATPLIGHGDCEGLIFSNISPMQPGNWCNLIAFDKATGEIRYRTPLKFYSWSSPVAFYNEKSEMFIVTGDTYGNIYIISGKDGKVLHRSQIGNNFESSPIAVDSCIIVGSRGQEIYKLSIQ